MLERVTETSCPFFRLLPRVLLLGALGLDALGGSLLLEQCGGVQSPPLPDGDLEALADRLDRLAR